MTSNQVKTLRQWPLREYAIRMGSLVHQLGTVNGAGLCPRTGVAGAPSITLVPLHAPQDTMPTILPLGTILGLHHIEMVALDEVPYLSRATVIRSRPDRILRD